MQLGDVKEDEGRESMASTSASPLETEAPGNERADDGLKNSSKRSRGGTGERSSSPRQIAEIDVGQKPWSGQLLDKIPKELIVAPIRARFLYVEEGLLNLLKQCLIAELPIFTSAALSGYVDHFQTVDDDDHGWGCGWRNIQILCSFLLAEDPEAGAAMFNGAGFVPEILSLQMWLEIAWSKGFDRAGAEYFNWTICGTREWIGTTECAALLRSLGVRAKIVTFTAIHHKRNRSGSEVEARQEVETSPGQAEIANSRGGATTCDECGKVCSHSGDYRGIVNKDSDLCDSCMQAASQSTVGLKHSRGKKEKDLNASTEISPVTDPTDHKPKRYEKLLPHEKHHWDFECGECRNSLSGRRYKSLTKRNFDLCSKCMIFVEEQPKGERGSPEDYVMIEEVPASRIGFRQCGTVDSYVGKEGRVQACHESREKVSQTEVGNEHIQEIDISNEKKIWRAAAGGQNEEDLDNVREVSQLTVRDTGYQERAGLEASISNRELGGSGDLEEPPAAVERSMGGTDGVPAVVGKNDINHRHLIEWVWSYFTEDSTRGFAANSRYSRDLVTMSKRSPLYLQHRGHSRTIVGIERRRKATGISEDVYLLILDPSLSSELLVKSLREKSGWQKLIKSDVHSLKESRYQLCYADPGIAVDEELEQMKVITSLNYSYYST